MLNAIHARRTCACANGAATWHPWGFMAQHRHTTCHHQPEAQRRGGLPNSPGIQAICLPRKQRQLDVKHRHDSLTGFEACTTTVTGSVVQDGREAAERPRLVTHGFELAWMARGAMVEAHSHCATTTTFVPCTTRKPRMRAAARCKVRQGLQPHPKANRRRPTRTRHLKPQRLGTRPTCRPPPTWYTPTPQMRRGCRACAIWWRPSSIVRPTTCAPPRTPPRSPLASSLFSICGGL